MHGSRNSYLDSICICGVGTIFFVDIVHSKYINFPVSKQITKLLCRHGGEQGSLGALETPGAGLAAGAGGQVTRKALREIWQHQHQQHLRVQQEIYSPSGDLPPCLQYLRNRGRLR